MSSNASAMVVIAIAVAVVAGLAWVGRKLDQRRHREQLGLIQERIRRRQESAAQAGVSEGGMAGSNGRRKGFGHGDDGAGAGDSAVDTGAGGGIEG